MEKINSTDSARFCQPFPDENAIFDGLQRAHARAIQKAISYQLTVTSTPRQRLETILCGGVPDAPPHFELVFYLYKEMFGMDLGPVLHGPYGSEAAKSKALEAFHREVALRCVEEFGYAAVTAPHYNLDEYHHRCITEAQQQ